MKNRFATITLLSLCFFASAHGMFSWFGGGGDKEEEERPGKEEKLKVVLCDKASELSAPKDFQNFMTKVGVGPCYDFMVELAKKQPKMMETTFGDIIKNLGGSWFGGTMKWSAEKFGVSKLMTDGLIDSRPQVRAILEQAAGIEKQENEKEVLIFDVLSSVKNMDKILPEQTTSLCTLRALLFVAKEQEKVVNAIKEQMLGKNLQKIGVGKVLDWVVPGVFDYSVNNQEELRTAFALMGRSVFVKPLEKNALRHAQDEREETKKEQKVITINRIEKN